MIHAMFYIRVSIDVTFLEQGDLIFKYYCYHLQYQFMHMVNIYKMCRTFVEGEGNSLPKAIPRGKHL